MAAQSITVPSVGESITEGILARWLKSDGSEVKAGDPLFELETDKATSIVPAAISGVLKIAAQEGQTVAIGASVGTLDPSATPSAAKPAPTASTKPAPAKEPAAAASAPPADSDRPLSPAVRRMVEENQVNPTDIAATGPGGRITKGDVVTHLESKDAAPTAPPVAAPAPPALSATAAAPQPTRGTGERETRQRMSGLRQRIAQRLLEAQQNAAILTTFNEADMSAIMRLREKYKEAFKTRHEVGLGFMSFFVKASVEALKAFPNVNGRIDGSELVLPHYYDLGVAVSTERGLMVPVLRDADRMSFAEIEKTIAAFADKARKGTISVDELQGGTFTITNGGIFGSLLSTPILNPPQSAILGIHAIKKRAVVVDDQIVIRPMMYLALSYDHRIIDGREAVSFLVRIKDCLEDPERMLLAL